MTAYHSTYRFKNDKDSIKRIQNASKDKSSDSGVKIENGLLIGTKDWFKAIDNGEIEKHTLKGVISKVYMSGHNDWPEFEIDCDGNISSWTREGIDKNYEIGKRIEIDFVIQKFKRPIDILGPTTKQVIEIRIEK